MATRRIETKRETPDLIELVMTAEEAGTLVAVLDRVGGSPTKSARRHADKVYHALKDAGILRVGNGPDQSLYFEDDERATPRAPYQGFPD